MTYDTVWLRTNHEPLRFLVELDELNRLADRASACGPSAGRQQFVEVVTMVLDAEAWIASLEKWLALSTAIARERMAGRQYVLLLKKLLATAWKRAAQCFFLLPTRKPQVVSGKRVRQITVTHPTLAPPATV